VSDGAGTRSFGGFKTSVGRAYQVIDVTNEGMIKGVATWQGAISGLPPVEIQIDTEPCREEMPSQSLQVNPNKYPVRHIILMSPSATFRGMTAEFFCSLTKI
jgi:hypothetical protein